MIKALITDMDGVLIDSEPSWREGMISVFAAIGAEYQISDAVSYQGLRSEEIVSKVLKENPGVKMPEQCVNQMIYRTVGELVLKKAPILSGVSRLVEVSKSKKIPLALATSTAAPLAQVFIGKIGIGDRLDVVCTGDQVLKGKPDPEIYLLCAERLGVKPEHCLVFEDSVNGMRAAKSAGMKCIVIPEYSLRDDTRYSQADMMLNSLECFDEKVLEGF